MVWKRRLVALGMAVALAMMAVSAASAEEVNRDLPTVPLKVGAKTLVTEVALTSDQKRIGLMNRPSLDADRGMIFIYEKPRVPAFWMKNTLIPLSAAFLTGDGVIVKIADMQPGSEEHHSPDVAVSYVLEVNQGWFAKAGVRVGDRIDLSALRGR